MTDREKARSDTPRRRVRVGGRYEAVVTGRFVVVRIISAHSLGGWWAQNESTGRTVWIKRARQLTHIEG
jgi:hypothetical protein